MSDTRPTTGHTLTVLPELRPTMGHFHEAALTYRGRVWMICTEGVGREVTDETPATGADGIVYSRTAILELLADGTDRETRPLESWVRTFGARLEGNFHLWERRLTIARDDLHESECGETFPTADDAAAHAVHCLYCRSEHACGCPDDVVLSYFRGGEQCSRCGAVLDGDRVVTPGRPMAAVGRRTA